MRQKGVISMHRLHRNMIKILVMELYSECEECREKARELISDERVKMYSVSPCKKSYEITPIEGEQPCSEHELDS